ncbi:MAG: SLATT domain-containing protein [Nonomuraea sp.]|nr:SLATT domain-containing protein [Nonomuraea sp.]
MRTAQFLALYRELRISEQRAFYELRSRESQAAHEQTVTLRNVLLVLSALAGVAGQLVSGTGRAVCGVVAAVLAALAGAVTAYEALMRFSQLHKLYGDAALSLAEAEIDWDADTGDLKDRMARVEQVFLSERGQWGQLQLQESEEGES